MTFVRPAACAAVFCLALLSSASQQSVPAWWTTQVTLKQEHADIRDALRAFFRQINVNYSIAPEVQGTISCDIAGNAVEVLPRILAAVHSHYRKESGVVQIVHDVGRPNNQAPQRLAYPRDRVFFSIPSAFHKVRTPRNLDFDGISIQQALATLFTRVPERYWVPPQMSAKVNGHFGRIPLDDVLRDLCNQAHLSVRYVNDVFEFAPSNGIYIAGPDPANTFILKPITPPIGGDWIIAEPPSNS